MGSGKRDFGDFNAKVNQHIERLPDYAQRAQQKLQRYFPSEEHAPQPRERSRPVRRPDASKGKQQGDVPGLAEFRAKLAQWNDPAAKLERRKRRASRALTLWIVLTILSGLVVVAALTGVLVGSGGSAAFGGAVGVVVFGSLIVRSGMRIHHLKGVTLPAAPSTPALPDSTSAAREPMEQLAESEESLGELLAQLSAPIGETAAPVPEISIADARATANDAAVALRGLADRIQAIERAKASAPESERAALETAVRTLRQQLDDGVEGYGKLVAAAGRAVAASSGGTQPSREALTNATDHLAGLAVALRELS